MSEFDNLSDDVETLQNQIRNLQLRLQLKQKNIPTCQLCLNEVECPVTLNGFINELQTGREIIKKCPNSQVNPICLICARAWMENNKKTNKITWQCLSRCCIIKDRGYETYGEIGRKIDDVPEPTLYRQLGDNGITQCRRCNVDCVTVYNLAVHIKTSCRLRKVCCQICKSVMTADELEKHKINCYYECKYCKIQIPKVNKDEILEHLCDYKPIFKCKFCDYSFSTNEIIKQGTNFKIHKCARLYKNETKVKNNQVESDIDLSFTTNQKRGNFISREVTNSQFIICQEVKNTGWLGSIAALDNTEIGDVESLESS